MKCTNPNHILKIDVETNKELIALKNAGFKVNLDKKIAYKIFQHKLPNYYERHLDEWGPYATITDIPCGHCQACRVKNSKDWSIRCWAESQDTNYSYFVTLTYDDEHNDGMLHKDHLQYFIDRLRKHYPSSHIRYLACGEYGTTTNRPHYHLILFMSTIIEDLTTVFEYEKNGVKQYTMKHNSQGQPYYYSHTLEKIWKKGQVATAKASIATYAYVARYVTKKNNDNQCFILASLKPGIGNNYFEKNYKKILNEGIVINGEIIRNIPRAWEKILQKIDPVEHHNFQIQKSQIKQETIDGSISLNEEREAKQRKLERINAAKQRDF